MGRTKGEGKAGTKNDGADVIVAALWEQQPGENEMSFHRFTLYRDMAYERNVGAVAKLEKVSYRRIRQLFDKNRWEERARAYDIEQDRVIQAMLSRQQSRARRQHFMLGESLLVKVAKRLNEMQPSELTPRDLISALNTATELQRIALGLPTNTNVRAELTGKDGDPLPPPAAFYDVRVYLPANGRDDKSNKSEEADHTEGGE